MKLTRQQEELLIQIGLTTVLEKLTHKLAPPIVKRKAKNKWSPEQRAKFLATMKAKWAAKKKSPK
jgi:hypothetical protein